MKSESQLVRRLASSHRRRRRDRVQNSSSFIARDTITIILLLHFARRNAWVISCYRPVLLLPPCRRCHTTREDNDGDNSINQRRPWKLPLGICFRAIRRQLCVWPTFNVHVKIRCFSSCDVVAGLFVALILDLGGCCCCC